MSKSIIPIERIASQIFLIRGEKVMLDAHLADLYGVTTSALNQQVKRNPDRFPGDFASQVDEAEFQGLISQNVISNSGRGGRRKPPWVFTEQGVAMLSSVLRSRRAAEINVVIMRTFVRLRQILATNEDLARKVAEHDRHIAVLFEEARKLLEPPEPKKKNPIGYIHEKPDD